MLDRLSYLARSGDHEAAQALALHLQRSEDWTALRRLARLLIDAGAEVQISGVQTGALWPLIHEYDPCLLISYARAIMIAPVWTPLIWTDHERRLFACDCAERVLPIFESQYPSDLRPREAISAVRRRAAGDEAPAEARAAWSCACAGARAAARTAAKDAEWSDAYAAAREASWSVVRATAWDSPRDVAWVAARAAAWARAAEAARTADRTARKEAAAAARAEERNWQRERLLQYLLGEAEKETDDGRR